MGYELHITRQRDWTEAEEELTIPEDEWNAFVASDPQLEFRDDSYSTFKDGTRRYLAFLVGNVEKATDSYVHADEDGLVPPLWNWLMWSDGILDSKYPSTNMIRKMISVAEQLGAIVQGDEGEIYFLNEQNEIDTRQPDYTHEDEVLP